MKIVNIFICLYNSYLFLLLILLILAVNGCTNFKKESRVKLSNNNGYTNLLVSIDENVAENHLLIERIKESFTRASKFLFNVTKHRFYFKEITILVPNAWSIQYYVDDNDDVNDDLIINKYDNKLSASSWEMHDRADICIEQRDELTHDTPFTFNYNTQCGQNADHSHFTPDFFLKNLEIPNTFGKYEHVLIHEFAHLRYGIFDEHPYKSTNNDNEQQQQEEFYINANGEVEATKCNNNLSGKLRNPFDSTNNQKCQEKLASGLPSNECIFEDDVALPVNNNNNNNTNSAVVPAASSASLMYRTFLDHVTEFCDNDPDRPETFHNRFAPTQQNKMCDGKSVWEVLKSHQDFKHHHNTNNNHQLNLFQQNEHGFLTPKFKLVKKMPKRIVLVIDSMVAYRSPLSYFRIRSALHDYVNIILNDDDHIAIIHFDKNAKIIMQMTRVKNVNERKVIFDKIMPTSTSGSSSNARKRNDNNNENKENVVNIWNALSLGLNLLTAKNAVKSGGNLVLITGSHLDSKYPKRSQIYDNLDKNKVTVDILSIGGEKHDEAFDFLARNTDGIYFQIQSIDEEIESSLYSNKNNNNQMLTTLDNSLIYLSRRETNSLHQINVLYDANHQFSSAKFVGSIKVDQYVADQLHSLISIKFVFTNIRNPVELTVYEPENAGEHKSKYLTDCYDHYGDDQAFLNSTQEIICKFVNPQSGMWTYEIVNTNVDTLQIGVHVRVMAAFHNSDDPTTKFPFYYRSHTKKKKLTKNLTVKDRLNSVLQMEAKWATNELTYSINSNNNQQVIYAKLSKNFRPILNASVKAIIQRPNAGSSDNLITIQLYDNGLFSDQHKDDGIYSRNFVNFNLNGIYSAQIVVETNSFTYIHKRRIVGTGDLEHYPSIGVVTKIDEINDYESVDELTRVIYMESFRLTGYRMRLDLIPPAKIKDLRVIELNLNNNDKEQNKTVTINFTAPGDDAELGKAAYYDIKCMYDPEILIQYEDIEYSSEEIKRVGRFQLMKDQPQHTLNEYLLPLDIIEASFGPNFEPNQQGGRNEYFKLNLNQFLNQAETVSMRMRAIDRSGNVGPWSQLITIRTNGNMTSDTILSPKIKHYHQHLKSSGHDSDALARRNARLLPFKERFYWKFSIAVICVFVLIGLLQLIVTLMVVVMETRERYQKVKEEKKREYGPFRV